MHVVSGQKNPFFLKFLVNSYHMFRSKLNWPSHVPCSSDFGSREICMQIDRKLHNTPQFNDSYALG